MGKVATNLDHAKNESCSHLIFIKCTKTRRVWETQMPPWQQSPIWLLLVLGHGQDQKVINLGVIWKDFSTWICIPNMKSASLMIQSYDQG